MRIAINYRLTGTGWSECVISCDEKSCVTTASYLSDALGNLVRAAVAVLSGFSALIFSFEEEPGEYRWVIRSARLNEIDVAVLEFPDLYGGRPDHEGKELLRIRCIPEDFAQAVYEAAARVLGEEGETGYAEKWSEHEFPTHQLVELGRLLEKLGHAV
ncbi:hypothetical protein [Ramlibacter humi]|uniref:Uncharacterized protein n=1 Tax=Ramlibacter humi TaxID=2530451 RepID=A0A4Z0C8N4_9BURK|nr:hypothetical protein [Ramlibacter humi]TFZ07651.1 hypothetical protein EZ216_00340 [Ramlibacter humi]